MMGDLKKRASFARVVNYVNNPKKARLIDSKDVRLDDNTTIAMSMQGQADDKPGRKLKIRCTISRWTSHTRMHPS